MSLATRGAAFDSPLPMPPLLLPAPVIGDLPAELRARGETVKVRWLSGDLIDGQFMQVQALAGPTISELLDEISDLYGDRLPRAVTDPEAQAAVVWIGGHRVPRDRWSRVRPKPGAEISITLDIQGGGGTVATLARLALVVAALYITAGAAGFSTAPGLVGFGEAGTSLFTAGSLSAKIAAATVLIGGNLAISALTPPPSIPKDNAGTDDATGKAASLSGNLLVPGGTPPRVIGTRRVFPMFACNPLIEVVDGNVYVEGVLVLGGSHDISAPRAGDVSFADFASGEIDYEIRRGSRAEATIQSLVTRHSHTRNYGTELPAHIVDKTSPWKLAGTTISSGGSFGLPGGTSTDVTKQLPTFQTFVSKSINGDIDEVWAVISFPEGLGYNSDTQVEYGGVAVRGQFRKRGASTWINLPEMHFMGKAAIPRTFQIKFIWATAPSSGFRLQNISTEAFAPGDSNVSSEGPSFLYGNVPAQTGSLGGSTGGWTTDSYFRSGVTGTQDWFSIGNGNNDTKTRIRNSDLSRDNVLFYLDEATFPKGDYEFRFQRSAAYRFGQFTLSNYNYAGADNGGNNSSKVRDFFGYAVESSNRVPNDQSKFRSRVAIARVSSILNDNPLATSDFASISVRVKNRALDAISVLASGLTYDWDGSGWNTLTASLNPVVHLRDVMTGAYTSRPVPTSLLNNQDFLDARTRCIAQGYACNAVIDGKSTEDVRKILAGTFYGQLRQSEDWGIFFEYNRSAESPVWIGSARNTRDLSMENSIVDRPRGLRVRFDDETDEWKEKQILVVDPYGINPSGPYEEVRYEGITTAAAATARATFDLKSSYLRQVPLSFTGDAEQYQFRRGALIGLTHDILQRSVGFGRVKQVLTSGGNVTGIVLDAKVPRINDGDFFIGPSDFLTNDFFAISAMGVDIECDDGSELVKTVTATTDPDDTLMFVTPFPINSQLVEGCHVKTGPIGSIYERLVVLGILPQGELQAEVICVPEAPDLMAA